MTDYELFKYTHSVFSENADNAPVKKLVFISDGVEQVLDFTCGKNMLDGCEVFGITRKREKRDRDADFKNYFYLQFGFAERSFNIPVSEDYVVSFEEMPVPKRGN